LRPINRSRGIAASADQSPFGNRVPKRTRRKAQNARKVISLGHAKFATDASAKRARLSAA